MSIISTEPSKKAVESGIHRSAVTSLFTPPVSVPVLENFIPCSVVVKIEQKTWPDEYFITFFSESSTGRIINARIPLCDLCW